MPPKSGIAKTKAKPKSPSSSSSKGKATKTLTKSAKQKSASSKVEVDNQGSTTTLRVGKRAPNFSLPDDKGNVVKLSGLKGKKVVLFFYPKDNTPGCTQEACSFRDGLSSIRKKGAVVYGVSGDSISSHQKFSEKFQLNFPLLSDESKKMLQTYGVWKEKSLYGRKFMGIERTTVLLDEKGVVTHIFPKVKVTGHYKEVLAALQ